MPGYKDFTVGEVLTAADVDDYLANGPFIHLTRGSVQAIANNTATDMSWTVETSDRSSLVAVTLTTITVPAALAGVCLISAYMQFATNATGFRSMSILVNGTTFADDRRDAMATAAQPHVMHASMTRLLAASDTIKVVVFQSSGGSLDITTSATLPHLTVVRLST